MPVRKHNGRDESEISERRRRDLLDAAFEIVAERGLEGLRTRDVAARAGVNIATLHYYFGTKEALVEALVDDVDGKLRGPESADGAREVRTFGGLHDHLREAWRRFHATPHLAAVLQELVIRGQRDPAAKAHFRTRHLLWNKLIEELLSNLAEEGKLRPDLDPTIVARVVTSFVMGAMMQLEVNPRAFSFDDAAKALEQALTVRGGARREK